jgi:hypothetical protein
VASHYSAQVYRSPPDHELPRTSEERVLDFGYERDIQPTELERRIGREMAPPNGWKVAQLLFSSGQAALHALLMATCKISPRKRPLLVRHLGSYFETAELLQFLQETGLLTLQSSENTETVDICIYEPVGCIPEAQDEDRPGSAKQAAKLVERSRVILCDVTLCRHKFDYRQLLFDVGRGISTPLVAVFRSGLKLDQAGLELANVGIVSVFSQEKADVGPLVGQLRRIRTLGGTGLRFEDINALSVPWFLGRNAARYADRVFENNRSFALSCHKERSLTVQHPTALAAPFSLVEIGDLGKSGYKRFESMLLAEAERREILLQLGGSFGFRGHRFHAIIPTTGRPFIRLAIGARGDTSAKKLPDLFENATRTIVGRSRQL